MAMDARSELTEIVRDSGLVEPQVPGIALVSGGADSACLLAGLAGHCGGARLTALHLNYRLRDDSDAGEEAARLLAERLEVGLEVERPALGEGNVQELARDARYDAAARLADRTGAGWIATGHSRTDLAETFLYRLAVSPGTRSLLGLPRRRGRLVRPLLDQPRERLRRLAEAARLPFRDDPTNLDPGYARNRLRLHVLPEMREIGPVEETIARTRAELEEEAALIERVVREALVEAGGDAGAALPVEALASMEPALRRLVLRELAERVAGRPVPLGSDRAGEVLRVAGSPQGGRVDLGGGVSAVCEFGHVRVAAREPEVPEPAALPIPGRCRYGGWEVEAILREGGVEPGGPEVATLDAGALGTLVTVRPWKEGDRMRPLGLGGSKSLQDVFTDSRVPRSLRRTLPVVESDGRIAWVAGVAVSEEFRVSGSTRRVAVLRATAI